MISISIRCRGFSRLLAYLAPVVVCPLLGVWLTGKPLGPYLAFPPIPVQIQPPPFSWAAFWLMAALILAILSPFLTKIIFSKKAVLGQDTGNETTPQARSETDQSARDKAYRAIRGYFPSWGWHGIVMLTASWILAWNRFEWFKLLQEFTFTPLWLGYILIINGLAYRRSGHCLLTDRPRYLLTLFGYSAVFWWSFEYLNRFIANWYYLGIGDLGPALYFVFATLPFSTVLPAVLSTAEWLETFSGFGTNLNRFRPWPLPAAALSPAPLIGLGSLGLLALAVWPNVLFFLVWLLPIALLAGVHLLTEQPPLLLEIEAGRWRRIWILAVAGLICGFFWELWNSNSLAHWQYSVPYLQRFKLFEMPLLGYAGYLPFGITCGLIADFVLPSSAEKAHKSAA